jgi:hypothetical protein
MTFGFRYARSDNEPTGTGCHCNPGVIEGDRNGLGDENELAVRVVDRVALADADIVNDGDVLTVSVADPDRLSVPVSELVVVDVIVASLVVVALILTEELLGMLAVAERITVLLSVGVTVCVTVELLV